jgi:HEAT repeat protein
MSLERTPKQKKTVTLADALTAIGRGVVRPHELDALSDLSKDEVRQLGHAWLDFPEPTRIDVVRKLTELAENDVLLQFGRVFRLALSDTSASVRQMAVLGLWEEEDPRIISTLIAIMNEDESVDVRAAAASGLGRYTLMVSMEELGEPDAQLLQDSLLQVLRSLTHAQLVRRRALESLAALDYVVSVDEFIAEFYDSDDTAAKASAIFAMGKTSNKKWLPTVIELFESDDSELRYEAARAAGFLGRTDAVSGLSTLMTDTDVEIRHAAIASLGEIGGQAAIRVLERFLGRCSNADREAAEEALDEAQLFDSGNGFGG